MLPAERIADLRTRPSRRGGWRCPITSSPTDRVPVPAAVLEQAEQSCQSSSIGCPSPRSAARATSGGDDVPGPEDVPALAGSPSACGRTGCRSGPIPRPTGRSRWPGRRWRRRQVAAGDRGSRRASSTGAEGSRPRDAHVGRSRAVSVCRDRGGVRSDGRAGSGTSSRRDRPTRRPATVAAATAPVTRGRVRKDPYSRHVRVRRGLRSCTRARRAS